MFSNAAYEQRLAIWNSESTCYKSSWTVSRLIRRTGCKTCVNDKYVTQDSDRWYGCGRYYLCVYTEQDTPTIQHRLHLSVKLQGSL